MLLMTALVHGNPKTYNVFTNCLSGYLCKHSICLENDLQVTFFLVGTKMTLKVWVEKNETSSKIGH